ncbi:hypothetical protein B6N60_01070 [Richelia sinica FACHB-800]|uniref:Uncharacterized protein n=1 Tax=Richelia sinica FACHB-800 TaxID=1357546 RepID=A0A975T590_9NOST|nr:hypothetical protein B6N60_01070 [Richelia sinica FACHB-800]
MLRNSQDIWNWAFLGGIIPSGEGINRKSQKLKIAHHN